MRQRNAGVTIVVLIAFAGYAAYVVIASVSSGKGHGAVFWASIGLIVVLGAIALWAARRLWRSRSANRN